MNIAERIARRSPEDIMWIGMALEQFYNGDAGTVIRAMANAITSEQFDGMENHVSADRKLGRAEGLAILIKRIEQGIDDLNRLNAEIKEEQRVEG